MSVPKTKADAYKDILERGEDVSLRKQVAAHLAIAPMTTDEITRKFAERGKNSIRPRVNELIRMDCVERRGTRENPSGHSAYVHHLTPTGAAYLRGNIDPEPDPPLSQAKANVVDATRDYLNGKIGKAVLSGVVEYHDSLARKLDPKGKD